MGAERETRRPRHSGSIAADLLSAGPAVWERFKRGPAESIGYYQAILDAVRPKLGDHPIVAELADAVAALEQHQ